jgi:uncharacterized protein (TIGR04255 family)
MWTKGAKNDPPPKLASVRKNYTRATQNVCELCLLGVDQIRRSRPSHLALSPPMVDQAKYKSPPITEAVLEFRFGERLSARDMERLRDQFKGRFPRVEITYHVNVNVGSDGKAAADATQSGFKLFSEDAKNIVMFYNSTLLTSRLAPYLGWDTFFSMAETNFATFKKVANRPKLSRIGLRFINRIDVPEDTLEKRKPSDLFRVNVALPETIQFAGQYSLFANTVERETGIKIILQSAIAPPALLDHVSFGLDIDAYIDTDLPLREDSMWEQVHKLRKAKNLVFESCISPEIRELFG